MEELGLKKKRLFTLSLLLSTNALSAFTKAHIVGKIGLKSGYIYTLVVVNAVLEWDLNISRVSKFDHQMTKNVPLFQPFLLIMHYRHAQ